MIGIGLAAMCAGIAWMLAFKRLGLTTATDPFGFEIWQVRAALVGGALVAILAVARYLTYRPGRGMRIGLANFLVVTALLLSFFTVLMFLRNGGDLADTTALLDHVRKVLATYGSAVFVTFAAFLSSELLLARL